MKKLAIAILMLTAAVANAATNAISALTEITAPSTNTLLELADLNATPKSRKITIGNLATTISPLLSSVPKSAISTTGTWAASDIPTLDASKIGTGTLNDSRLSANVSLLGSAISESELSFTDITTANATSSAHGLLPKLSGNTNQFLNGNGSFITLDGTAISTGTISDSRLSGNVSLLGSSITEGELSLSDNSTANASTSAHGFLPKLPGGTTNFLRSDGAFAFVGTNAIATNNAGNGQVIKFDGSAVIWGDDQTGGAGSVYVNASSVSNPNFQNNSNVTFTVGASTNINLIATNISSSQIIDGTIIDGDIAAAGITTRSKLPSAIAYEDEANTFSANQTWTNSATVFGWKDLSGVTNIDYSASSRFYRLVNSNFTWTTSNEIDGTLFRLLTEQDSTGSRIMTFPSSWVWTQATNAPSSTPPNISTNAGVFVEFEVERRSGTNYARIIADRDSVILTSLANNNTSSSQMRAAITDETGTAGGLVFATGPTLTDAITATSFQLVNGTGPTTDASGEIAIDTNADGTTVTNPVVQFFAEGNNHKLYPVEGTPSDGQVVEYQASTKRLIFATDDTGGGGGSVFVNGTNVTNPNWTNTATVTYTIGSSTNVQATALRVGVYRTLWLDASAFVATTTNGATAGTYAPAGADNFTKDIWSFKENETNYVNIALTMPDEWDLGTVKAKFYWTATAGSGDVVWQIAGGSAADDDALGAVLGTYVTVTDTLIAFNDQHITAATGAITIGGSPALGHMIILTVKRDTSHASDTQSNDVHLFGVAIQYKEGTTEPSLW